MEDISQMGKINLKELLEKEIEASVGLDNEWVRIISKNGKYKIIAESKDKTRRVIINIYKEPINKNKSGDKNGS